MIHVDRSRVPAPDRFESVAERELEGIAASVLEDRRPKHKPLKAVKGLHQAVRTLFHGKCAYCETPLGESGSGDLDHFRPRSNARGHSGGAKEAEWRYRHHYWWLSWEWRNLYLACEVCCRNKGTWFPVVGERAPEGRPWEDLASERSLFIDPCIDDPEKFFRFDEAGRVHPRADYSLKERWLRERAESTIKLLGLNRPALVKARKERLGQFRREMAIQEGLRGEVTRSRLSGAGLRLQRLDSEAQRAFLEDPAPYAGACRSLLRQLLERPEERGRKRSAPTRGGLGLGVPDELDPLDEADSRATLGSPSPIEREPMNDDSAEPLWGDLPGSSEPGEPAEPPPTSPEPTGFPGEDSYGAEGPVLTAAPAPEEPRPDLSRVTAFLQRVTVENFRAIEKVILEFSLDAPLPEPALTPAVLSTVAAEEEDETPEAGLSRVGWWVLLGENGSGKSSVLQAVALGLAGEARAAELLDHLGLDARRLQRRAPEGAPKPEPLSVSIELSNEPHRISYQLEDGRLRFDAGREGAQSVVRAYGTSRLPPRNRQDLPSEEELGELVKVESLFNPHETLIDTETWLLDQDPKTFRRAAMALEDLFRLPEGSVTRGEDDGRPAVLVQRGQDRSPLSQLSDGYQALTGLVAHLMAAIPKGVADLQQESGIVLIDELGVHLHPKWRMNVVRGLRTAFPKFQFLATTHEPLCLRGLQDGEVGVMMHLPTGVSVLDKEVPSVAGLRVDQLLTSSHFGLDTTIDPDLDLLFKESYALLREKRELERAGKTLAADRAQRLETLEEHLAPHRILGYTRQDQLVYEILGDYLDQEPGLEPEERRRLRPETKERVLEAWKRVRWAQRNRP